MFCTPGTRDLCSLVLPDSAHIQEEDARDANRHGYTKHSPALPLYTAIDAARALIAAAAGRLQPSGAGRARASTVEFINAGHLLGSAYARVTVGGKTILFGGDLGRYGRPCCPIPSPVDRRRRPARRIDLRRSAARAGRRRRRGSRRSSTTPSQRGGKLIIPSFAIGRVEEVLYWLKRLEDEKRIPVLPVYVDSPMAAGALQFYRAARSTSSTRTCRPRGTRRLRRSARRA